jgi:hypothetical protein
MRTRVLTIAAAAAALIGLAGPAHATSTPTVTAGLWQVTQFTPTGCPRTGGTNNDGLAIGTVTETVAAPRTTMYGTATATAKVAHLAPGKYQAILAKITIDNTAHIVGCEWDRPTQFTVNSRGQGNVTTNLRLYPGSYAVQLTVSKAGSVFDEVATTKFFAADIPAS